MQEIWGNLEANLKTEPRGNSYCMYLRKWPKTNNYINQRSRNITPWIKIFNIERIILFIIKPTLFLQRDSPWRTLMIDVCGRWNGQTIYHLTRGVIFLSLHITVDCLLTSWPIIILIIKYRCFTAATVCLMIGSTDNMDILIHMPIQLFFIKLPIVSWFFSALKTTTAEPTVNPQNLLTKQFNLTLRNAIQRKSLKT